MINTEKGSQEIWSAERVKALTMSKILSKSDMNEIRQKQRKSPYFKTAVSLASAAALICLMVLGGTLLFPQDSNIFELKVYAMEQMADGSMERREVDLLNESYRWGYYDDSENVYINLWLKCDGENIERVDFHVDEGFFATQNFNITLEKGQPGKDSGINGLILVEAFVRDGLPTDESTSYRITQFGYDYVNVGSHFTLKADEMTDDLLLFWGRESRRAGSDLNLPSEITIRAVANFNDGKTQEEILAIDLSPEMRGFGAVMITEDEQIEQWDTEFCGHNSWSPWYHNVGEHWRVCTICPTVQVR